MGGMAKKNLTSKLTFSVACLTAVGVYFSTGLTGQIFPIISSALIGFLLSLKNEQVQSRPNENALIRPNIMVLGFFLLCCFWSCQCLLVNQNSSACLTFSIRLAVLYSAVAT